MPLLRSPYYLKNIPHLWSSCYHSRGDHIKMEGATWLTSSKVSTVKAV